MLCGEHGQGPLFRETVVMNGFVHYYGKKVHCKDYPRRDVSNSCDCISSHMWTAPSGTIRRAVRAAIVSSCSDKPKVETMKGVINEALSASGCGVTMTMSDCAVSWCATNNGTVTIYLRGCALRSCRLTG